MIYKYSTIAMFVLASFANLAQSGEIIFNDAANAKIARLKGKARILKNTRQEDLLNENQQQKLKSASECGSVNIGNTAAGKIGTPPKKVEIFVIGDIINVGNDC